MYISKKMKWQKKIIIKKTNENKYKINNNEENTHTENYINYRLDRSTHYIEEKLQKNE